MTCFYPLKRWIIDRFYDENGVLIEKAKVTSYESKHPFGTEEEVKHMMRTGEELVMNNFQEIPCGKCIGCRLDYSKQWADRCVLESKNFKHNYMLTLTYDDAHLPVSRQDFALDGSIVNTSTLVKSDLKKFLDRLRTHWRRNYDHSGIRFYACGEYGELYGRAHYHILLFNLPIFDLTPMRDSQKGFTQWTSPTIEKLWNKGLLSIVNFNWDTAAYVARYVMKKQKGPGSADYYKEKGQIPEFVTMSTHPGIAREYFEKNKFKIYETDELFLASDKGLRVVKPCKYYDKLFDIDYPEYMQNLKEQRKERAEAKQFAELSGTELKKEFYNKVKENNLIKRTQSLKRAL